MREHNPPACIRQHTEWLLSLLSSKTVVLCATYNESYVLINSNRKLLLSELFTIFMLTACFFFVDVYGDIFCLRDLRKSAHTITGANKTQCTTIKEQFKALSFNVEFGRQTFEKTINGSWVPEIFSAQVEILQKNCEYKSTNNNAF